MLFFSWPSVSLTWHLCIVYDTHVKPFPLNLQNPNVYEDKDEEEEKEGPQRKQEQMKIAEKHTE